MLTKMWKLTLLVFTINELQIIGALTTTAVLTGGLSANLHIIPNVTTYCPASSDPYNCQGKVIPPLPGARYGHVAAMLGDRIMVVGGQDDKANILNTAESFIIKQTTPPYAWISAPSLSTPRLTPAGAVVTNSKDGIPTLYVCGGTGSDYLQTCEYLKHGDPRWQPMSSMSIQRTSAAATAIGDNLYIIGGFNGNLLNSVEKYSTSEAKWSAAAPMVTARFHHAAWTLDGQIYVCGGANASGYVFAECERYDPIADKWVAIAPMLNQRYFFQLASLADGTISAIAGCSHGDTKSAAIDTYHEKTGVWVKEVDLEHALCFYALVVVAL